jgi:hypothetical protein
VIVDACALLAPSASTDAAAITAKPVRRRFLLVMAPPIAGVLGAV